MLFGDQPRCCACRARFPEPGSYRTVDLCGTPVLVTRAKDGRVHAMANVCRHRGVRVVDGVGETRRFTCPFHAWVYDLEGKLVGMPVADAFEGMCREEQGPGRAAGRRGLRPDRRPAAARAAGGHRRVPRPRAGRRAGDARLRRLGAVTASRTSTRSAPTGRSRSTPSGRTTTSTTCTATTLAKYAYGGVLTFDAVRSAPAQLLGAALDRRAARPARGGVGRRRRSTSATSTRCSRTPA